MCTTNDSAPTQAVFPEAFTVSKGCNPGAAPRVATIRELAEAWCNLQNARTPHLVHPCTTKGAK